MDEVIHSSRAFGFLQPGHSTRTKRRSCPCENKSCSLHPCITMTRFAPVPGLLPVLTLPWGEWELRELPSPGKNWLWLLLWWWRVVACLILGGKQHHIVRLPAQVFLSKDSAWGNKGRASRVPGAWLLLYHNRVEVMIQDLLVSALWNMWGEKENVFLLPGMTHPIDVAASH